MNIVKIDEHFRLTSPSGVEDSVESSHAGFHVDGYSVQILNGYDPFFRYFFR